MNGSHDITAGDYVTYIDNELAGSAKLRIVAEASFLQPNVLALLVKGGSPIETISQLKNKIISVNAPDDIGTLLVDSLLVEHGISPGQVRFNTRPGLQSGLPDPGYAVTQAWAAKYPNTPEAFTRALAQGQQIADTDRAAVKLAVEKYLQIPPATAAFLSLPSFPTGVDAVRLQQVVSAMLRFGVLSGKDASFKIQSMTGG